jgi:hypothetical protein
MSKDENIFQAVGKAIVSIPETFHSLFLAEEDNDLGDVVVFAAKVGIFGTMTLCLSAVMVITAINLLYATGLGLLKIEYLLRVKYGYSQEAILKDPIGYLATMIAVTVFIVVLIGNLAVWLGSFFGA